MTTICRHIKLNGERCGSPALRDQAFCYFHRTLADSWAYTRFYDSTEQRNATLPGWLHFYNHHRPHSAIGGQPPVTRLTNVPGHHT